MFVSTLSPVHNPYKLQASVWLYINFYAPVSTFMFIDMKTNKQNPVKYDCTIALK